MKQVKLYTVTIAALVAVLAGCSRKKNSFVSRNLHAVGTEYNVLYNGNLALQAGLDELESTYKENYWDVLPVERMQIKKEDFTPGQKVVNPNFERAEEKAVKAVQKHSMLINEEEYNPQIDEAYLLLGKARYYDQRFVPALEAFNYILQFMPECDNINRAKIWRERTNMRLDYNETAVRNLKKLLKQDLENIDKEDLATANATLSQAYLNLEQTDSALVYMNRAAQQTKNRETVARYKFIAGQLFARSGNRDSAFAKFDEIIELHRKVPRRYYINAFVEKFKLFNPQTDNSQELLTTITDLEENRENRPWLDAIYAQKAIYYDDRDSLDLAVTYYNKSLRAKGGEDDYLKGNNYAALGRISFDQELYEPAGKYYDSALTKYQERTKEHRLVKKKFDNLQDVILYEGRRRSADSIFYVLSLNEEGKIAYYQEYIDGLIEQEKQLEEQAKIEQAKAAQEKNAFQTINNNSITRRGKTGTNLNAPGIQPVGQQLGATTFYFYNQQTVARGKIDFRSKWGRRKLEDNWRRKNRQNKGGGEIVIEQDSVAVEKEVRPEFLPEFYINQLPSGMSVLDSIVAARDFAYYQLGVVYKEKFKRNDLAIDRFTSLLDFKPEEKLLLPGMYNLYLVYQEEGAFAKAETLKQRILSEFPDTRYAQVLRNPESKIEDSSSPAAVYSRLYKTYEKGDYQLVIQNVERYVTLFNGDPIVPRLELLKAFASGRLYGFEEYKRGIDYVALNFPNTEVGKSAQQLVQKAEKLVIPQQFIPESGLSDFKLVYRFNNDQVDEMAALISTIQTAIDEEEYAFNVSQDVYNKDQKLIVVHGLATKLGARGLGAFLKDPKNDYLVKHPYIAIATENYKIVQIYKNLDKYKEEML